MNEQEAWVLAVNLAATWFMVGVIWFVQVVHYPQFVGVGEDAFGAYHQRHGAMTTWVVAPPMIVEAVTSILLVIAIPGWFTLVGLSLVAIIWLSTAFLQVPCHNTLRKGFCTLAHSRLCRSNWIRTIAWTIRGGLTIWMLRATAS